MRLPFFLFLFCVAANAPGQSISSDAITGTWLTADKTGQITIFKEGDRYFGKITAGSGDQKFDIYNPDKERRNDPLIGMTILRNLQYDGEDKWEDGTVYDPKSGKKYSCNIVLLDNDRLKITGYIGFSFIGRSEEWQRLK